MDFDLQSVLNSYRNCNSKDFGYRVRTVLVKNGSTLSWTLPRNSSMYASVKMIASPADAAIRSTHKGPHLGATAFPSFGSSKLTL